MDFDRLAKRYRGARAQGYESERTGGSMWPREQRAVDELLAQLPAASTLLDIPVGTGRFFELYKTYQLRATGLDISSDMLALAKAKAEQTGVRVELRPGDIRKIDAADRSFDCALCSRFMNWLDFNGLQDAFRELSRVAKSYIIVGVRSRIANGHAVSAAQMPWHWLREQKKRLKRKRRGSGLTVHDKTMVEGLFAEHGWAIREVKSADRRADQTDYLIYLLQRNPRR